MNRHPFRASARLLLLALIALSLAVPAAPGAAQTGEEASPPPEEVGAPVDLVPADEGTGGAAGAVEAAAPVLPPVPGQPAGENAGAAEEALSEPAQDDPAADLYLSRCAGCHTIGEGYLSGPDLAPSTEWPAPDLTKAVERMEKNVGPMTDEQVASLVELLKHAELKQRLSAARERQVAEMAATLEPASPAAGEELFHGKRAFGNRGVSCSACHRAGVRGGNLAADLTDSYTRLGEQALISAAENPGFPLMRAAYASHPVTRQEAVHLAAYLERVDEETGDRAGAATPVATRIGAFIGWAGFAAAALFLAAMVFLYRDRNRGVRAGLVRRAHQR